MSPVLWLIFVFTTVTTVIHGQSTVSRLYRVHNVSTVARADWLLGYVDREHRNMNVFRMASVSNPSVDLLVNGAHQARFLIDMTAHHHDVQVINDNFDLSIRQEAISMNEQKKKFNGRRGRRAGKTTFEMALSSIDRQQYNEYSTITRWMAEIGREAPDDVAQIFTLNKQTSEGRIIYGMRLGVASNTSKPAIVIESGMHSREWISVSTMVHLMHALLADYARGDPTAVRMLTTYDVHLIPVTNPDGYIYTHSGKNQPMYQRRRMWRKTRSRGIKPYCIGADPNRNWAMKWREGERSLRNPCSDIYAGSSAFSEPEIAALDDYVRDLGDTPHGVINTECLRIMNNRNPPPKWQSRRFTQLPTSLTNSAPSRTCSTRRPARRLTIFNPRGYRFELRPRIEGRTSAFVQPTSEIEPTGREIYAAFRQMLSHIAHVYRL